MSNKKRGRPTDNPKDSDRITIRLDKETNEILNKYCEKEKVGRAEGVRRGIICLKDK